jgi:hypothetical protein
VKIFFEFFSSDGQGPIAKSTYMTGSIINLQIITAEDGVHRSVESPISAGLYPPPHLVLWLFRRATHGGQAHPR